MMAKVPRGPFYQMVIICLLLLVLAPSATAAPGDPLPRISCQGGYEAFVYAEGLASPDGLAWGPDNLVYVAEESADQISRISLDGSATTYATNIISPEGISFAADGLLYAVEDIENGRLVAIDELGTVVEVAGSLDAPEGVATHPDGNIYITQSNVQFTGSALGYLTRVTRVTPAGATTDISLIPFTRSYAGITVGPNGDLFVSNEAALVGPDASVYQIDPTNNDIMPLTTGIRAAEGVDFSNGSQQYPLYLVEEDRGNGDGYLHQIMSNGTSSEFCNGFFNIEDVLVAPDGTIYVSEDGSGYIVQLRLALTHKLFLPTLFR